MGARDHPFHKETRLGLCLYCARALYESRGGNLMTIDGKTVCSCRNGFGHELARTNALQPTTRATVQKIVPLRYTGEARELDGSEPWMKRWKRLGICARCSRYIYRRTTFEDTPADWEGNKSCQGEAGRKHDIVAEVEANDLASYHTPSYTLQRYAPPYTFGLEPIPGIFPPYNTTTKEQEEMAKHLYEYRVYDDEGVAVSGEVLVENSVNPQQAARDEAVAALVTEKQGAKVSDYTVVVRPFSG